MKELSIEQKAKAYDKALEEDERIRKAIINEISLLEKESVIEQEKNVYQSWLAWLEKQGKNNMGISEATKQKLEESLNNALAVETGESLNEFLDEQGEKKPYGQRQECVDCQFNYAGECKGSCAMKKDEQKPVFEMKTPEESLGIDSDTYNKIVDDCIYGEQKSADNIESSAFKDKLLELFQKFRYIKEGVPTNGDIIEYVDAHMQELIDTVQNKSWSEEDETKIKSIIALLKSPALCTMDGNKGIIDESIKYLKSIKDRIHPQSKQEWNEEDEKCLENAIMYCEWARDKAPDLHCYETSEKSINWLKSLRPKSQWKPSEEQMEALENAIRYGEEELIGILSLLYNDLRKL